MEFEPVIAIASWAENSPAKGIVAYGGNPYLFERYWNETRTRYEDLYWLRELKDSVAQFACEHLDLWREIERIGREAHSQESYERPLKQSPRLREFADFKRKCLTMGELAFLVHGSFREKKIEGKPTQMYEVRWGEVKRRNQEPTD
jgi:hypothetical protein